MPPPTNGSQFRAMLAGTPLEECFRFWLSRRNGEGVPLKSSIDPVEMPQHIIPYLFIYERTAEGRLRCRLSGTAVCATFQKNPTGRYLDEMLVPRLRANRTALFQGVIDHALPLVYASHAAEPDRVWVRFRRLLLPVSISGRSADAVFGMVIFPEIDAFNVGREFIEDNLPDIEAWATPGDLSAL